MSEYPEVTLIARMLDLVARYGLEDLELEEGGLKVRLRVQEPPDDGEPLVDGDRYRLWKLPGWNAPPTEAHIPTRPETARAVLAPLTGHFYRAQTPDASPFVEVGDLVEQGQILCLIEAMKVFSDVHAEYAGRVVEIVPENGRLVHHGEILLYLDPEV